MVDWFRSWHGAPTDTKLTLVARKAGVTRALAVATWWLLLDTASQAEDRGSIAGTDPEVIACALDADEDHIRALMDAFEQRGMIAAGRVQKWDKRQPKRERENDNSAERVRAHRERERQKRGVADDVTPRNAMERPETPRAEQNREEQNKAEEAAPREGWRDVGPQIVAMLGWDQLPTPRPYSAVRQWIADGADPECDILPAIRDAIADGRAARANSLNYFWPAVQERRDRRRQAETSERFVGEDLRRAQWRPRLIGFRDSGFWLSEWGAKPGHQPRAGQAPCGAPADLVSEILGQMEAVG